MGNNNNPPVIDETTPIKVWAFTQNADGSLSPTPGGGAGNAAAGPTGSSVPVDADYSGINISGLLQGQTGFTVGSAKAAAVAIVDGSGNQITSFGGGTQFADNAASGATPTGTLAMGWDSANSKIRALKIDTSQNLFVNVASIGTVTVNQGTNPWIVAGAKTPADSFANPTDAVDTFALLAGWDATNTKWQRVQVDAGTGTLKVDPGTVTVNQGTSPWVTADNHFPASVALSDAMANPTTTEIGANLLGYNGSTWDRLRTLGIGSNVAATGIQANAPYGQFAAPFPAASLIPTSNNYGVQQVDSIGRQQSSLVSSLQPFIVQKANAVSTNSVTSLNASFPANNTAGNTIIVVAANGANSSMSVTDTLGNTYTSAVLSNNGTVVVQIFYATNCKAGANTNVTVTSASGSVAMEIYEVNGLEILSNQLGQAVSGEAQTSTNNGSSTSASTGSIVPLLPNAIAITGLGVGTANVTFSAFAPYTKDFSGNTAGTQSGLFSFASFSQPLSGLTATSFAATLSGSEPWVAATVFFKPIAIPIQGSISTTQSSSTSVTWSSSTPGGTTLIVNTAGLGSVGVSIVTSGGTFSGGSIGMFGGIGGSLINAVGMRIGGLTPVQNYDATSGHTFASGQTWEYWIPVEGWTTFEVLLNPAITGTGTATITVTTSASVVPGPTTVGQSDFTKLNGNVGGVGGNAVSTAANGTQLVGVADGAGNKLTSNSSTFTSKFALDVNLLGADGTAFQTAGVVDENIKNIANSAIVTAATGVQLVGVADGAGNKLTSNSNTFTSKFALDVNILGSDGTAFQTAGVVDENLKNVGNAAVATASSGVQKVGIVGNAAATLDSAVNSGAAPTNALWVEHAPSTVAQGALTPKYINSTAAAVLKATAGSLYGVQLLNLNTTTGAAGIMYVQFFNTTTTTGLSTTSWLFSLPIPSPATASTIGQALSMPPGAFALGNFSNGIVIVVNTTSTSNTTAAGTGVSGVIWIE